MPLSLTWTSPGRWMQIDPAALVEQCHRKVGSEGFTGPLLSTILMALNELKRHDEIVGILESTRPEQPFQVLQFAKALSAQGHNAKAPDLVQAARRTEPDHTGLALAEVALLMRAGETAQMMHAFDVLLTRSDLRLPVHLSKLLERRYAPADLLDVLRRRPGLTGPGLAVSLRISALLALSRLDEAATLMAPALVHTGRPDADDGPAFENFLSALAAELAALPSLTADPEDNSTRGGIRTTSILWRTRLVSRALAGIRTALAAHSLRIASLLPGMPAPTHASLNAWSILLFKDGHQTRHIHPDGWISGVFYVSTPGVNETAGALRLAMPPRNLPGTTPWPERVIVPAAGDLVLFPSWTEHETIPHQSDSPRICLAFDMLPQNSSRLLA